MRRNPIALAEEWRALVISGEVSTSAQLARELGVSRAHVTQVLGLLHLAPQAKIAILALGDPIEGKVLGAHSLRLLTKLPAQDQERRVSEMIARKR